MLLKLFFCLAALYVGANAAEAQLPPQKKPDKFAQLEGCYIKEFDRVLKHGEHYTPLNAGCLRYICGDDGFTSIASCGAVGITTGCERAAGNQSLPYPKCCDGIKCKDADGNYIYKFPY